MSGIEQPDTGAVTVYAWVIKWLQDVAKQNLAPSTFYAYQGTAKNHVKRLVGRVRLADLTPRHVASMERRLAEDGYGAGMINQVRGVLSGACRYAVQQGMIDRNPARNLVRRRKPLKPVEDFMSGPDQQSGATDPWAIVDRPNISVADWLEHWLSSAKLTKKVSTYDRYVRIVQCQIVPLLGDIELRELAPRHVDAMRRHLLESGLSPATVGTVLTVLSVACKYAYRLEILERNPVDRVERPKKRRRMITPPDVPSMRRLLTLAQIDYPLLYPFLHLLAFTGMRRGEAMALRWSNINLEKGYLIVAEAVAKTESHGLVVDTPKTASSERVIDLDEGTLDVLSRRHEAQLLEHQARGGGRAPELVFTDESGSHLRPTNMDRALKYLGRKVGLPTVTFHQFRHFHASLALQGQQNIVVVSKRLGHSSVSMTLDIYGHSMAGWQKGVADAVADAMEDGQDDEEDSNGQAA